MNNTEPAFENNQVSDFDTADSNTADSPVLTVEQVTELITELKEAAQFYYHSDQESPLTDEEFDSKLEALRGAADSYPDLFDEGTDGHLLLEGEPDLGSSAEDQVDMVPHFPPMLSLAKAKDESSILRYVNTVQEAAVREALVDSPSDTSFKLEAKLDGLALSVEYKDGCVYQASKRSGDGWSGERASYLLSSDEVTIVGIPDELVTDDGISDGASDKDRDYGSLELRGELFLTESQFRAVDDARYEAFGTRFKNSRNAAAGIIAKAKKGLGYNVEMTFSTYSAFIDGNMVSTDDLNRIDGIYTIGDLTDSIIGEDKDQRTGLTRDTLMEAVSVFGERRSAQSDIPTDGVVVKPELDAELFSTMGATGHHPISQIAFKYPGASALSVIERIDVTVGRTGRLTPVAKITPVDLSGTVISSVSLHNFHLLKEKDFRIGSTVSVTRANDVIPYAQFVVSQTEGSEEFPVPTVCPLCGTHLVTKNDREPLRSLTCENALCASRLSGALGSAVGKGVLDIDGLSGVMLNYLESSGRVSTVADLFTLTKEELAGFPLGESVKGNPRRLGESRAANIWDHIQKAKMAPLSKLVQALGIPSLGGRASKELVKAYGSIDEILDASAESIMEIPSFGPKKAETIVKGLQAMKPVIADMRANGVDFEANIDDGSPVVESQDSPVAGKSFSISGSVPSMFPNRGAMVEWLVAHGAEFHGSPKASTDYMIGDRNGSSSKIKKARDLGVQFITADEFMEMVG